MENWELDWIPYTVASRKASVEEEGKVEDFMKHQEDII